MKRHRKHREVIGSDPGRPRAYQCMCRVSRFERQEITDAAKAANLSVGDLTRMCTLHIIREGALEVHTEVRIATTKGEVEEDEEEQA